MLTQIEITSYERIVDAKCRVSTDVNWANGSVKQSLKIQNDDNITNYPKCNKPCIACPWTNGINNKREIEPTSIDNSSAIDFGFAAAYRANPEAIWFCHNTVMPPLPGGNGLGGGIRNDRKPTVCSGFLAWRKSENLTMTAGEFIDVPEI